MNYQETLNYLFSKLPMFQRTGKAAYKTDLQNTLKLDNHLNNPHKKFASVHVGGTNGKGSVSHILASILQVAGYKVGLYTSPHLNDFRERIKINGHMISKNEVISFVEENSLFFEKIKPSFFEMTVALAFDYFARENVDVAIIEVGLGGRLDSTNIISPMLSVITNIYLDHTDLLGDTIEKITIEKAGIIKKNTPVVIGETQQNTRKIFIDKAKESGAPIHFADMIYSAENQFFTPVNKQNLDILKNNNFQYKNLQTDILGNYQRKNIITVLMAIDIIKEQGLYINEVQIYEGIKNVSERTGFMGRWQVLGRKPEVICDAGHNADGLRYVVQQIKSIPYKNLHFVFGVVNDKKIDQMLKILPIDANYYFTRANIPRALNENDLATKAFQFGLRGKSYHTVKNAFESAKNMAGIDDLIFISGSIFVVAEVLE